MKIHIKNYQRHKDSEIEAGVGITALIGRSDHGKSVFERAIGWFCLDSPKGKSFVRKGTKRASVQINEAIHVKDGSSNYYELEGERVEQHKAVQHVNLGEVNKQRQFGKPFLIEDSPGERARQLAQLIDLEKPQEILKSIKLKGAELSAEHSFLLKEKAKLKKDLDELTPLRRTNRRLLLIESRASSIEKMNEKVTTLQAAIEKATTATSRLATIPKVEPVLRKAMRIQKRIQALIILDEKAKEIDRLISLISKLESERIEDTVSYSIRARDLSIRLKQVRDTIEYTNNVRSLVVKVRRLKTCISMGDTAELLNKVQGALFRIETLSKLDSIVNRVDISSTNLTNVERRESHIEQELETIKKQIGLCPICGSEM